MAALLARQIVELVFEYDYFEARDNFASEAQAEAETAEILLRDPAVVISYLEGLDMPVATNLADKVRALI